MRADRRLLISSIALTGAFSGSTAHAQEVVARASCREQPCAIVVDWTRAGGIGNQNPDRRYGNPTLLEERMKARLAERGFTLLTSAGDQDLRILMVPIIRNAMCDQLPGTATDMSCKAIAEVEVRIEGPEAVTRGVDIPSRVRNRCASDEVMPVDKLAVFLADWVVYAVDGRARGERRPVARC